MDANETSRIIAAVGGDAAFARLLGLKASQQRINNWKRRGIPADVVVANYELIQRLRAEYTQESN
ncbi:YdaS family helix-turn-helix protein [Aromatoleum anaerobium]|uniref:Uncharacterized protein n=1 Tax=Aromatoleum anaerobium TaxID=182180 RepID=A0ABX1PQQ6_9RHOO|nr:hypothetical protein [Aromatoleum anaerobium]MCK0507943.1 helix-turn-helix domain-containing protein [Aromatoleum anaerobium]